MTPNVYSNKTLYGIDNETVRYSFAGWYIFVLLSSVIGDTTILVSSIKYRAIRLHKLIVVIIRHIAACDLLVTLFSVGIIPTVVSLIADKWVLGAPLCYILPIFSYYFVPVGILLICSMTAFKLLILNYPLRIASWSVKRAHKVCATIWVSMLILPSVPLIIDYKDIYFSYRTYDCDFGYTAAVWTWLRPIISTIFLLLPNVFVGATTVCLLITAHKVARRGRENLKWQGITTTILVALVYCTSVLPYSIYHFAGSNVKNQESFFHNGYFRFAVSCLYLNTISNFYIYCLTVSSFREFLWSRIKLLFPFLSNRKDSQHFKPRGAPACNSSKVSKIKRRQG